MASRSEVAAGKAYVTASLRDAPLRAQLDRLGKRLKAFGATTARIGAAVSGAGVAVLAPLTAAAFKFAEIGTAVDKIAARTGFSTEALSGLGYAAQKTGVPLDRLHEGLTELVQRLGEAATTGTGSAADQLKLLGLEAKELVKQDPSVALGRIMDAINQLPTQGEQAFAIDEIFGGDGREMMEVLKLGSAGMAAMQAEAKALGLQLSGQDAQAAAKFTESWHQLQSAMSGVVTQIGAALAPSLTKIAKVVTQVTSRIVSFISNNRPLVTAVAATGVALVALGGTVVALGGMVTLLGASISGGIALFGLLSTTLGFLLSPLGLVLGAVGAATFAIIKLTGAGQSLANSFSKVFSFAGRIVEDFKTVIGGVGDALQAGNFDLAVEIVMAGVEAAFNDGIAALASAWDGFLPSLVEAFAGAMGTISKLWVGTQNRIAKGILEMAKNEGVVGDVMAKLLGVDVRDEQSRGEELEAKRVASMRSALESAIAEKERELAAAKESGDIFDIAFTEDDIAHLRDELAQLTHQSVDMVGDAQAAMDAATRETQDMLNEYWGSIGQGARDAGENATKASEEARKRMAALAAKAATDAQTQNWVSEALNKAKKEAEAQAEKLKIGGIEDPKREAERQISGTFSSYAAMRLGMGGNRVQERVATATEKTASEVSGLRGDLKKRKGPAFV